MAVESREPIMHSGFFCLKHTYIVTYIPISARNNSAQTSINRDVFPHIVEFFIIIIIYIYI